MSINTVADLRLALKGLSGDLPITALDRGSDTRPFQLYHLNNVRVGSVGAGANPPKTAIIGVTPK